MCLDTSQIQVKAEFIILFSKSQSCLGYQRTAGLLNYKFRSSLFFLNSLPLPVPSIWLLSSFFQTFPSASCSLDVFSQIFPIPVHSPYNPHHVHSKHIYKCVWVCKSCWKVSIGSLLTLKSSLNSLPWYARFFPTFPPLTSWILFCISLLINEWVNKCMNEWGTHF